MYFCFQAIPSNQEVSSADEAQAAKRPRLPSSSTPPAKSPMGTTAKPTCLTTTTVAAPAAELHSVTTPTSQSVPRPITTPREAPAPSSVFQMNIEAPMDTSAALTETPSESATDPMLSTQSTSFQSMLNSDPLLSAPSPPPLPQHMSDSYVPSSGYVSYMETLLHSHFPQDDDPAPLY